MTPEQLTELRRRARRFARERSDCEVQRAHLTSAYLAGAQAQRQQDALDATIVEFVTTVTA